MRVPPNAIDPPVELAVLIVNKELVLNTVGMVPPTVKLFAKIVVVLGPIVKEEAPAVMVKSARRTEAPTLFPKLTDPVVVRDRFCPPAVDPSIVPAKEMPLVVLMIVDPVIVTGDSVVIAKEVAVILPLIFTAFEAVFALVTKRLFKGVVCPMAPPKVTAPPLPANIVSDCI